MFVKFISQQSVSARCFWRSCYFIWCEDCINSVTTSNLDCYFYVVLLLNDDSFSEYDLLRWELSYIILVHTAGLVVSWIFAWLIFFILTKYINSIQVNFNFHFGNSDEKYYDINWNKRALKWITVANPYSMTKVFVAEIQID